MEIKYIGEHLFAGNLGKSFVWISFFAAVVSTVLYLVNTFGKNGEKAIVFNNLKSIKNLKYCKNLNSLTICGEEGLTDYTLSDLKNLNTLNIIANFRIQNPNYVIKDSNPQLSDISWISSMKSLENVSFRGCTNLVNIGPIKDLPNLKELDLRDTGVKNTGFLASSRLKITV